MKSFIFCMACVVVIIDLICVIGDGSPTGAFWPLFAAYLVVSAIEGQTVCANCGCHEPRGEK